MLLDRFFNRKNAVSTDHFCRSFYDSFVFLEVADGRQVRQALWDNIRGPLMNADIAPMKADRILFANEMTALELEVFGLAWMHHFTLEEHAGQEEDYIFAEIVFAKRYLEHHGFRGIWKAMLAYADAVDQALLHERVAAVDRDFAPLISFGHVASEAISTGAAQKDIRTRARENWSECIGIECSSHLSKRISTRDDWGGRPIVIFLAHALARRLLWDIGLESQAFVALEAIINRLYNDSKATIESVNIQV